MKKFFTKKKVIVLIVVLAVVGVVSWVRAQSKAKTAAQVQTATVSRGEVKEVVTISGKIVADKKAVMNFQVTGKVAYIGVKMGDGVRKGQLLAGLDTGELDTAARTAYYQYLSADAAAKKVEDDVKDHDADETFLQKSTRVAAQTTRDMAYDAWQLAMKNIQKANLYAPFEGVVTDVTISATGDTAGLTDGVTIVAPEGLHFEGEVDESDIGKITLGQPVKVTLDAFDGKDFWGTISRVGFASRLASSGANVYPVEINFPNGGDSGLRLGMNGDAEISTGVAENVLMLPVEAVIDGKVIVKGETEGRVVVVGLEGDRDVEIKEGLVEGDVVLIK